MAPIDRAIRRGTVVVWMAGSNPAVTWRGRAAGQWFPRPHGRRRVPRTALAIALMLAALPVRAEEKDPIDVTLDACLAAPDGQSTAGMSDCTGAAIDAWDTRLNQTYQKTLAGLDPKSRALLREAQRRWLAFRTAESELQGAPWRQDRGTVVHLEIMSANLAAIKERVAELRLYLPGGE